ncbi:MAG: hypothetical protein JW776_03360 [Candidatus Lokiarchaeota archaeon]|nr:hypothetical protein [Candidatus Lokiarchaeota archaeon]
MAGSLLSAFFALIIFGFLVNRRRKKRGIETKSLVYIEIVAFCLGLAALIDGVFLLTHEVYGIEFILIPSYEFVNFGSYLSFSLNAISNFFLLTFAKEIFGELVKKGLYLVLSIVQIAVVPALLIVFFSGDLLSDFELIPFIAHILCSIVIYILFSVNAFKIRKVMPLDSDQDYIIRKALGDLGMTGIFMLLAVLSFVAHEIFLMTSLELLKKEAVTIAFGWIFGGIAAFFMYSGYVSPELMKKRIE